MSQSTDKLLTEIREFMEGTVIDLLCDQLANYRQIYSERYRPYRLAAAENELTCANKIIADIDKELG